MRKFWSVLLAFLLLSAVLAPSALAMDQRSASRLIIDQSETIDDDAILTGDAVTINGTVHGDVYTFAQTVQVNGTIDGNLIAAGSNVEIRGIVKGSVFGAGNDVTVRGRVDGSLVTAGNTVTVDQAASVGRSWLAAGKYVTNEGTIGRGVLAASSWLSIEGQVGREVKAWVDNFTIGSHAVVNGPVVYTGSRQLILSPGARTGAVTFHLVKSNVNQPRWQTAGPFWRIALKLIAFLVFGLALLSLFPGLKNAFPQTIEKNPWQAPLVGFLALLAIPVGAIILAVTIIGIPISITALLLFPVAIYVGQVLLSWTVATLLANHFEPLRDQNWVVLFLVGAVVTTIVTELPVVGSTLGFIAVLYGLGGLWFAFLHRRQNAQ